jgi:hypothetical protein
MVRTGISCALCRYRNDRADPIHLRRYDDLRKGIHSIVNTDIRRTVAKEAVKMSETDVTEVFERMRGADELTRAEISDVTMLLARANEVDRDSINQEPIYDAFVTAAAFLVNIAAHRKDT